MKLPETPKGQAILLIAVWFLLAIPIAYVWVLVLERMSQ